VRNRRHGAANHDEQAGMLTPLKEAFWPFMQRNRFVNVAE
jgi:hypothetical protein